MHIKLKLNICVSLCAKMLSSEFYFLAVFTAELAPFSISYPSSNTQAAQIAYVGTGNLVLVGVAMSLGATQLTCSSAGLNSRVSRLW